MTELKTLKDIETFAWQYNKKKKIYLYREDFLKQEAIKWVKSFIPKNRMIETRSIFMEFFNITEEDLK